MIAITPSLALDESESQFDFVRASGPGGQNVNKVATAVQLHFDVRGSPSLPEEVKARLVRLVRRRVSEDGIGENAPESREQASGQRGLSA